MTTSNGPTCPLATAAAAAEEVLRASRKTIDDISVHDPAFLEAVELIAASSGTVITTGVGMSGELAKVGANLLSSHTIPATFIHATDGAAHGLLGAVTARDIVLAVSESGCTPEVVDFADKAQQRAAHVIVLTSTPGSALSHPDRIEVVVPLPAGEDFPKASSAARIAWFGALTAATAAHRRVPSDGKGHMPHDRGRVTTTESP